MIRYTCDCGKKLKADPSLSGKWISCPDCGKKAQVPSYSTRIGESQDTSRASSPATDSARNSYYSGALASEAASSLGLPPAIPGYQILGVLGRGGMGIVYKAVQLSLDRLVAIKMILASTRAKGEARERFILEARSLSRLRHSGIVQVFDFGEHEGHPYFVMEFVEGRNLAELLSDGPIPFPEAVRLVRDVAHAMNYAHAQGILHRDLKPLNILIGPDGSPRITDFGLAKHLEAQDSKTQTGAWLGTPAYMSPEQANGDKRLMGPGTDIWSLGIVLYELLTGRLPFEGPPGAVFVQILREPPIPPSQYRPDLPTGLEAICLKAVEKDPARRFRSMADFAYVLEPFAGGAGTRCSPGPASAVLTQRVGASFPADRPKAPSQGEVLPVVEPPSANQPYPANPFGPPSPNTLHVLWFWYMGLAPLAASMAILMILMSFAGPAEAVLCLCLGWMVPGFACAIIQFVLLHKMWSLIQDGQARASPGQAWGFLLIPFFNFYWTFQAHYGLACDFNAFIYRHRLRCQPCATGLILSACILSLIPYLNVLTLAVMMPIAFYKLKNTAADIAVAYQTGQLQWPPR